MSVTGTCRGCANLAGHHSQAAVPGRPPLHLQHSCDKRQRRIEVTHRRAQPAQGRARRECAHPRARHAHGTRAAYVKDRCRCPGCTAANTAASHAATRQQALGRWQPFIDARPVREHIAVLRAEGIGVDAIARLAGTSTSHIRQLADPGGAGRPPIRRVRPNTAQRILHVEVSTANRSPLAHVDATGTRRRLQALVAVGWPMPCLAAELGRTPANLARSMTSHRVTAQTARQVSDAYERLWDRQPPHANPELIAASDAARGYAAGQRWAPPLAWDDIDHDPDPDLSAPGTGGSPGAEFAEFDELDEIAVERAVAGDGITLEQLTLAEQNEVVRRLTERGKSVRDIAQTLSTTKRTVCRHRAISAA